MVIVEKDFRLKNHNTFGINATASQFVRISSVHEISSFIKSGEIPEEVLIMGGGSNLLFTGDVHKMILYPEIKGIVKLREDDNTIDLEAGCAENWDSFVEYCCQNDYSGLENLSLIPGNVGASPVQNIGAYGVEVKDRILWVEGIDMKNGEVQRIFNDECRFEYRKSIFKQELSNRFIITSVAFRLDKNPNFILGYGDVEKEFREMEIQNTLTLRECIVRIRERKLPDPETYGNAGSFFKNPVIPFHKFSRLRKSYPDIPSYPEGQCVKIPAAWLIEKAGWKGAREGNTGTWPSQPLVIVNYGNATGKEIFDFSERIMHSVKDQFDIELEREVRVI